MRRHDEGSAIVEFIIVGIAIMVPLVYVVQCAMVVHSATLASSQAVREAGRAFSTAVDDLAGRQRAAAAARLAFADQGLALPAGALRMECPDGPCLAPGSVIDVRLDWQVPLPWLPADWSGRGRAAVPISAHQRVPVDDFRGDPESSA
ncbi:MAG: pilus assembly protein [Actinomycetes bacterium]